MIHKIKLRKAQKNETIICPYAVSGRCYRNGCIFKPEMDCLKRGIKKNGTKGIKNK